MAKWLLKTKKPAYAGCKFI